MKHKFKITKDNIRYISKISNNIEYNKEKEIEYISIYTLNKKDFKGIANYFIGDYIILTEGLLQ